MRYREEETSLCFASPEEAASFHGELTELVREAMVAAGGSERDVEAAVDRNRDLFKRFKTVARALNSMRRSLPRHGT